MFILYCTNALQVRQELPKLAMVQLPEALAVEATYGMVLMRGAKPEAAQLR